jgi:hypothetical protein
MLLYGRHFCSSDSVSMPCRALRRRLVQRNLRTWMAGFSSLGTVFRASMRCRRKRWRPPLRSLPCRPQHEVSLLAHACVAQGSSPSQGNVYHAHTTHGKTYRTHVSALTHLIFWCRIIATPPAPSRMRVHAYAAKRHAHTSSQRTPPSDGCRVLLPAGAEAFTTRGTLVLQLPPQPQWQRFSFNPADGMYVRAALLQCRELVAPSLHGK